jgi:DNA replication and repair protein RecF
VLAPGIVLVTGSNGAGKTNLLEALHVGSQGFSPRTRADQQLIRFGQATARVRLKGSQTAAPIETDITIAPRQAKRVTLNGAPVASAEVLRARLSALVFVPDRLAVVKGGPLVRRTYVDRMLGRMFPPRANLPVEYARVLAQRNEALRRVRGGVSTRTAVEPWTQQLAELGTALDEARAELVGLLAPGFAGRAETLGLADAVLAYAGTGLRAEELDARLPRDIERGTTGAGPHLRDVEVKAGGRDLRGFGSQGEQRLAVLALLLAEAELAAARRGSPPLLLLDDVFSELDEHRRAKLLSSLPAGGQTILTATERGHYPAAAPEPRLVVHVRREEDRSVVAAT